MSYDLREFEARTGQPRLPLGRVCPVLELAFFTLLVNSACWTTEVVYRNRVVHVHDTVACIRHETPPPFEPCRGDLFGDEDCKCPSPLAGCYQVIDCTFETYEECEDAMGEAWRRWSNDAHNWINLYAWPRCADLD